MFDWRSFLDSRSIPYVTTGPNVARDHVAVRCPFCSDDPSEHMGISLAGRGWSCWRNQEHRGKSPARLIAALAGCTLAQAHQIAGTSVYVPDNLKERVDALLNKPVLAEQRTLTLPKDFRPFADKPSAVPFLRYLHNRGLTLKDAEAWGLYYAVHGPFHHRIIFPVYDDRNNLVTFTGRSISPNPFLRYKVLSPDQTQAADDGMKPAIGPITDYLLFQYELQYTQDADTLFICEGPFDALKMSVLGYNHGIIATCLFTSNASRAQIDLLHDAVPGFKRTFILLDRGTLANAMRLKATLAAFNVKIAHLPEDVKDPGDLDRIDILIETGERLRY